MPHQITITLQQIKVRVDNGVFTRGKHYYDDGAIGQCIRRGARIEARCQGSYPEPYRVWVQFDDFGIVEAGCTCEYGDTWGGDCKHIIALLLTYLHKPQQFEERPTLQDALANRSKEDLIDIIERMVAAYPDLQRIVDRPTVREVVEGDHGLEETALRRELSAALAVGSDWDDEWGESAAADKVYEITEIGDEFARRGDYPHAIAVYCLILEECNAHDFPDDDEYVAAINEVFARLDNTVDHVRLGAHDALRRRVLDALLGAYFWDMEYGGIGGYDEGVQPLLLGVITQQDIPYVRQQLAAASEGANDTGSGDWWDEALEELQMELDRLDETDPEVTLARLRAAGLHNRQVELLLSIQRVDEALDIVAEQIHDSGNLIHALSLLSQNGQREAAVAIAEKRLRGQYDWHLADWLINHYAQRGDHAKLLEWRLRQMQLSPSMDRYTALAATAQQLGTWDTIRPQIQALLAKQERLDLLIQAHLHDQEWTLAWEMLSKIKQSSVYGYGYQHLEFEVAQQTRHVLPERAIPIYMRAARDLINQRKRDSYAQAAQLLVDVRDMYQRMGDPSGWDELIAGLRSHLKSLRALQDELNQAGL